jgi:DNA repair protein RecO (recombination protein O)
MKSNDLGVFLYRTVYSDSSLIVTFFTRENGVQKFLFRGGKKKAHSLFPMSICELSYYGHKHSDLLNLTSVESAIPLTFQFHPIRSTIAFFAVECIKKSMHQGDRDEEVFQFLVEFAKHIEKDENQSVLPLNFLIELSEVLGFKPYFEEDGASYFNLDAGVFQTSMNSHERIVEGPAVDLIAALINRTELNQPTSKQMREQALNIMLDYFKIHVPRFDSLTSFEIVKEVLNA